MLHSVRVNRAKKAKSPESIYFSREAGSRAVLYYILIRGVRFKPLCTQYAYTAVESRYTVTGEPADDYRGPVLA